MKLLNKPHLLLIAISIILPFSACKKEGEEEAPEIKFKTGAGYVSSNATIDAGKTVTIGVLAEVKEEKDPLVKFNISKSVNDSDYESVYSEDLNDEQYEYDYTFETDSAHAGNEETFSFTVTNRDGLTGQCVLTLTIE